MARRCAIIERLVVRNYQSIAHADLELGRFTVVVGPSSSGKSALMRALKMLASNARGASFVRYGEKTSAVSAHVDGGVVTLLRGEGVGEYKIFHADGRNLTFTKLGGAVPEEVGEFLGIRPKDPLHFAGQFDRPYLLDDSGSEVARALGELTNVSLIFAASKEANRKKAQTSSELKTRLRDQVSLRTELEGFRGLPGRIRAQEEAEAALTRMAALAERRGKLSRLLQEMVVAEAAAERARAVKATAQVPSYDRIEAAADRLAAYKATLRALQVGRVQAENSKSAVETAAHEVETLNATYHQLLVDAGECPVCGSLIEEEETA